MSEDFLSDIKKEGSDPFEMMEKDTPEESTTSKEPEADKPAEGVNTQDDNVPFHKHPRWIERENELKELRERDEATAKELAELKTLTAETSKRLEPTSAIPEWFIELYGANEVAWRKYSEHDRAQRDEMKREVLAEQEATRQQQTQEAAHWNKWVDTEIDKLKEEGHTFDRNKLIKTMLDYRPTDEQGNFDFKRGIEIYKLNESKDDPAKSQARKELADATTRSPGSGGSKKKDYMTAGDLRHRSWANL